VIAGWSTGASAATLYVASNGEDHPGCGAATAPCRSISKAIERANPGDRIVVGPGRYGDLDGNGTLQPAAGEERGCLHPGGWCMIEIDKPLTIESSAGAAATVLDAGGSDTQVVAIHADDVVFGGGATRGFTLAGWRYGQGLIVPGGMSRVRIRGNQAVGGSGVAFWIDGRGHTVDANLAVGNHTGFRGECSECRITRNVASRNESHGFVIGGADSTVVGNVAIGNGDSGMYVYPARGITFRSNSVIGNRGAGFYFPVPVYQGGPPPVAPDVDIVANNVFGNSVVAGSGGCGLFNGSGVTLPAPRNYWGAPTGPGADPADQVCDRDPGVTEVTPFAVRPFAVAPPSRR
jgi:parallel beta-helix repeat protein